MNTLLHGSYFGYNFGDTLLCRLFADWIRLSDPEGAIAVPLANRRNADLIGADLRGLSTLRKANRLVMCGGGYLGEPGSGKTKWTLRAYARHMLLANWAAQRMPVNILAVGVGPLSDARLRRDVVALFDAAEAPVVRDDASAQFLRDWGVRTPVEVKVDAVVTATREELMRGATPAPAALALARAKFGAVIAVHTDVRPSIADLEVARGVVQWLLSNTPFAVALVSDGQRAVKHMTWSDKIEIAPEHAGRTVPLIYSGVPEHLMGILDDVDLAITTKLHFGIVRCALGKPVISVPHHSKTPRFYAQMGLNDWCVPHDSANRLGYAIDLIVAWMGGKTPDLTQFETARSVGFYRNRLEKLLSTGAIK
jgi:polysaccharide pyruvyl transferase WcaK-like protein